MVLRAIRDFRGPKASYSAPTYDALKVQNGGYSTTDLHWYYITMNGQSNRYGVMGKLPFLLTGVLVYELTQRKRLKSSSMPLRVHNEHQTVVHVDPQW